MQVTASFLYVAILLNISGQRAQTPKATAHDPKLDLGVQNHKTQILIVSFFRFFWQFFFFFWFFGKP